MVRLDRREKGIEEANIVCLGGGQLARAKQGQVVLQCPLCFSGEGLMGVFTLVGDDVVAPQRGLPHLDWARPGCSGVVLNKVVCPPAKEMCTGMHELSLHASCNMP